MYVFERLRLYISRKKEGALLLAIENIYFFLWRILISLKGEICKKMKPYSNFLENLSTQVVREVLQPPKIKCLCGMRDLFVLR